MSRVGTALWLFAIILVADCASAAGFQVRPERSSVSDGAAGLAPEARSAQPSVLPRGLPRVVTSETHRQKAGRGHDGHSIGLIPEEVPLPLVTQDALTPNLRSHVRGRRRSEPSSRAVRRSPSRDLGRR
jgi:hypothetical protein